MKYCKLCGDGPVCCDYCAHYAFNGNEKGHYTGDGRCKLHDEPRHPGSVCDDYECSLIEKYGLYEGEMNADTEHAD